MIVNELYPNVLLQPRTERRANLLYVVSGYASATFARRHLTDLLADNENLVIRLIIGMPGAKSDHLAFVSLHEEFNGKFMGYYLQQSPPVHCKVYSWYHNENPILGFAGSANYSQFGFFSNQQLNQISTEDPTAIKNLFETLLTRSIFIPDHNVVIPEGHPVPAEDSNVGPGQIRWDILERRVTISFLDRDGNLPQVSGLNWGQRREKRINRISGEITYVIREPNQAYLSVKQSARDAGFLPETAFTFSLITDDGHSFDCVVAQEGRKAIESTNDNSELGKYFRNRLGVPLGAPVLLEDLERYGRTDYAIEKIDDETFLLDFSI